MQIFSSVLTLVTGPRKRQSFALQTSQILVNRDELCTSVEQVETEDTMAQNVQEPSMPKSPTGFPEPLSLGEFSPGQGTETRVVVRELC